LTITRSRSQTIRVKFGKYLALLVTLSLAMLCLSPAIGGSFAILHGPKISLKAERGAVLIQFDGKLLGMAVSPLSIAYLPAVLSWAAFALSPDAPPQFVSLCRVLRC
jgi:hypothetical protein